MKTANRIVNESPLLIFPAFAAHLGLNAAIVLQQVHYWLNKNEKNDKVDTHFFDYRWWAYNTYQKWKTKNFPWWTTRTIERIFADLRKRGFLDCQPHENDKKGLWVTINYEKLNGEIQSYQRQNVASKAIYARQKVEGSGVPENSKKKETNNSVGKPLSSDSFQTLYEENTSGEFESPDSEEVLTEKIRRQAALDSPLVQYVLNEFGTSNLRFTKALGDLLLEKQKVNGIDKPYPSPITLFNTDKIYQEFVKERVSQMRNLPQPDVEKCLRNISNFSHKKTEKTDEGKPQYLSFHYWAQKNIVTIERRTKPKVTVIIPLPAGFVEEEPPPVPDDDYTTDQAPVLAGTHVP